MNKLLTTLAILLIATAVFAETYTVERVIDGDIIKLTNGEEVQLIGVDAPESHDNDKAKRDAERTGQDIETINKMGQEATEFVKGFALEGMEIRLEYDVQEKDKYGRLLGYVYIQTCYPDCPITPYGFQHYQKLNDGLNYIFLNATIIKSGYATPMTIPPNVKYADLFKELYEEARENKRGLWR